MSVYFGCVIAFLGALLFGYTVAAQDRPKIFLGASSKTPGYSPLWQVFRSELL